MLPSNPSALLLSSLLLFLNDASVYAATTYDIDVGKGGLRYDPETVTAAQGDTLRFHFYGPEHNVAQSTFDKPCEPATDAIFSGDVEVEGEGESDVVFNVLVNNTNPIWIYCSEGMHCPSGMAMVVNPPKNESLNDYKSAAKDSNPADPDAVSGGVLARADQSNSSSSSSSTSASTSASAATMSTGTASAASSSGTTVPSSSASTAAPAATSGAADSVRKGNAGWMVAMGLGGAVVGGII